MAAVITTLDQHNDQQQQIVEVDSARRRAETVHALSSRPQLNIDDVDDDETFNKKPTRLAWSNCSGTAAVNLRLLVLLSGISCCAVPKLRQPFDDSFGSRTSCFFSIFKTKLHLASGCSSRTTWWLNGSIRLTGMSQNSVSTTVIRRMQQAHLPAASSLAAASDKYWPNEISRTKSIRVGTK